jgi:hypothetical protein
LTWGFRKYCQIKSEEPLMQSIVLKILDKVKANKAHQITNKKSHKLKLNKTIQKVNKDVESIKKEYQKLELFYPRFF